MPDQHVATSVSHTVAPLSEIDPELAAILEGELSLHLAACEEAEERVLDGGVDGANDDLGAEILA